MTNETEICPTKSKHAIKQALGIKTRLRAKKMTLSLAVASHVRGDDTRWNPNDDDINFNP